MARFVLDASAVLALIQGERGAERITQALEAGECFISAVNISEAMAKLSTTGVPVEQAMLIVSGIPAEIVPCEEKVAFKAASLAVMGKPLGLSLGDRICLATAQVHGGLILTTEQTWRKVHLKDVEIEVVRELRPQVTSVSKKTLKKPHGKSGKGEL